MRYAGIILLMVFVFHGAAAQDKTIRVDTQPSWPPGSFVPVRIEIVNHGINDFARFYQDLPQGFTVKRGNTAGADFYWDNNQVNFVWVNMPDKKIIRISYLAKADESLTGSFRLGGKLDYIIEGDKRGSAEFGPVVIHLDKKATVEEDIDQFIEEETAPENIIPADNVYKKDITEKIVFRVQVAISSEHITKAELESRIGCPLKYNVTILRAGNMYKYQSGAFKKYSEANIYLGDMKNRGVNDAFIVAYRGEEQISIELARTLEK